MKRRRVENISQFGRDVERRMEHTPSTSKGGVRDNSRTDPVSVIQVQSAHPTFEVLSKTELCGFCREPAILSFDSDNDSKLLRTLRSQFISTRNQNDGEFVGEIHQFCPPCKTLATQLWECDELVRKTLQKLEIIKDNIETRVVEGILSDPEFQSTTQLQLPEKQKRMAQLKNDIFDNYRRKLREKKLKKFPSCSNAEEWTASTNTLVSCDNRLPDKHTSPQPKTGGSANTMIGTGSSGSHESASAIYKETYSSKITLKETIHFTSNKRTQAAAGGDGRSLEIRRSETPFSCIFCAKSYVTRSGLMQHLHRHTGEKPFSCYLCNKKFGCKSDMINHLRTHTGEKPFKCNVCNKRFAGSSSLRAHSRIHTGEKPFKCIVCNKRFAGSSSLRAHSRVHTGEKPFKCDVCNKTFNQKSTLTTHSRTHTGEKPFNCKICGKAFGQRGSLSSHLRSHTGERPFKCAICEKQFGQKRELTHHLRLHTGEKPFKCSVCKKRFNLKSNLTVHYRRHTGEKPFKCNVCCKTFRFNVTLKAHEKIHKSEL